MYTQIANAIKPMLDKLAQSDADFAKDYQREDKSIGEFAKLFYDACSKGRNGGNAVFGSDDMLLGLAIHYYHEDDVKELDVTGISIVKASTPKSSAPTTPAPKTPKPTKTKTKTKTVALTPPAAPAPTAMADEFDFDDDEEMITPVTPVITPVITPTVTPVITPAATPVITPTTDDDDWDF